MRKHNFIAITKDEIRISCCLTVPENFCGKTTVLLHGFSSGQNNSTNLAIEPGLLKLGSAVLKFDFRGCGKSSGHLGDTTLTNGLKDLRACLLEFEKLFPQYSHKKFLFIGSSFGASVALASSKELHPYAIVMKSPILNIYESQLMRRGNEEMAKWKDVGYIIIKSKAGHVKLKYDYVEDSLKYDFTDPQKVDFTIPLSIVHGSNDEVAPVLFTEQLIKNWSAEVNFLKIDGASHQYSDSSDFFRMIEFISHEAESYLRL